MFHSFAAAINTMLWYSLLKSLCHTILKYSAQHIDMNRVSPRNAKSSCLIRCAVIILV